ncbi:hypothetical protein F5888DRAFT_1660166 [Russula emetica]|nr:hypothetical protein F5888DRAFT_1660166 [Russula emetica]
MNKRAHQDSAGPFLSRFNAGDILGGEIERPGGFIEGRIHSTNPRTNQYTIDVRPNSKAKADYLAVAIEDKLQRRLGELFVGDHLRILLQGAHILPNSDSPTHLPIILRYREGITVLLMSRAGLQGEKEKLLSVWPNPKTGKAKKRKQTLNVDNRDVEWFSTPPLGDGNIGVEEGTSGMQAVTGDPNPTNSSEPLPTPPADVEIENVAGPSTSATASVGLKNSKKSPLTTGEGRGAATYAYRAAPSRERSSPVDPTSIPEFPSAVHSAIPPIPVPSTSRQQLSGRNAALPSGGPSEARSCSATSEEPPSSKQKSNRKRKREKSKEATSSAATMSPATTNTPTPTRDTPTTQTTVDMHTEQNAEPISDDSLNMRAGLVVNGWPYTALSEIRHSVLTSIIGVVSFVAKGPTQTQRGDWCICISLLDPSVLDSFGGVLHVNGAGIKINCFMRVEQWLPNPKQGDVILLRQVKIQHWNDNLTGTCYANTMQWAIYDPLTEDVLQPDPKLNSHRSHNPPTWHIVSQEREYCVQLTRWWAAVQKTRVERQGTAVQIGGGPIVTSERKHINRQHLLISEADPGREPHGYFNCTVEILHGHANHISDIYSIYVTDYTSKPGTFAEHSSEWCPVSLADRVLRIEMWRDKAVTLAQQMNPGEYWSLDNVRMKVSNAGYIEGSFSETAKARKLSTADLDTNPHLQALLQRKKLWEENDNNPHVFPHKLFEEVELQSIFDCTVEVLHAEYNAAGTSTLYITDYTERSDLATPPTALGSRGLEERIVTLELQGQQSKMADKIETGSFFTVKHMRLIERVMGIGRVVGRIGGPDRLIHKLNVNNPNEELEKLLERRNQRKGETGTARRNKGFTTIARVLKSDKRVDKFRVRARVVGTYPLRLEGCVVRSCKSCSEQLPAGMDTCTPCTAPDGATPECENVYHLFLRLQDEHGKAQITVTVDQNSSILGGLVPEDVMGASSTTQKVRERLAGYIGNLEAVQAANSQGRTLKAEVPVREFTIESWNVEDDEGDVIAYGLL